ncbi:hypothetical protein AURDEDRAFT_166438 [Auricularia subglabra TFB-10046 SS5]|uniref:MYND-type domain-containing protein n=1 Tax=Auricularia subglabra (strain TFB-10046 / SS5) TaxID=717982 RepID=J0D3H3_AURST|nr:hypothetical protein AURDEDRAFT_166438 [Auricularia subglabra TFB-10046 SS5]
MLLAILVFLTTERSASALADLAYDTHSSLRSCPHQLNRIHFILSTRFETTVHLALDLIGALSSIADTCFAKSISRAIRFQAFPFRQTWPASTGDLLPTGTSGFKGLLFWFTHSDDALVLSIFMRVFLWCRPAFYAEFANPASCRLLCQAICSRLESAADRLRAGVQSTAWGPRSDPAAGLEFLTQILDFLVRYCSSEWPAWKTLFRGSEAMLLTSTFSAMDACGEEGDLSLKDSLRQFAFELYTTLDAAAFDAMPDHLANYVFDEQIRHGGCYGHFRKLLGSLSESARHCGGPDCPRKAMKNVQLSECQSCRIMRYCSRECQRQHWNSALRPHKPLCRLLKGIIEVARPSLDTGKFAVACRSLGVDIDRLSAIYAIIWEQRLHGLGGETQDSFATHLRQMDLLHEFDTKLRIHPEHHEELHDLAMRLIGLQTELHMLRLLYRYLQNRLGFDLGPLSHPFNVTSAMSR